MKRSLLIFSAFLFCLVYWACQKNESMVTIPNFQDPFITPAIEYLKTQISERSLEKLDFNSVQTLKTSGVTTGISIGKKDKTDQEFAFIQKIENQYKGNWVQIQNRDSANSGILITTSFDNNLKSEVTFLNGRALRIVKTDRGTSTTTLIKYKKDK